MSGPQEERRSVRNCFNEYQHRHEESLGAARPECLGGEKKEG